MWSRWEGTNSWAPAAGWAVARTSFWWWSSPWSICPRGRSGRGGRWTLACPRGPSRKSRALSWSGGHISGSHEYRQRATISPRRHLEISGLEYVLLSPPPLNANQKEHCQILTTYSKSWLERLVLMWQEFHATFSFRHPLTCPYFKCLQQRLWSSGRTSARTSSSSNHDKAAVLRSNYFLGRLRNSEDPEPTPTKLGRFRIQTKKAAPAPFTYICHFKLLIFYQIIFTFINWSYFMFVTRTNLSFFACFAVIKNRLRLTKKSATAPP